MRELTWHGIAFAATAGVSLVTIVALYRSVPALRRRWFPLPRLRPGTWTGREVFIAFSVLFGLPIFILALLLQIGFFTPLIGLPPDAEGPALGRLVYTYRCLSISSPFTLTVLMGSLFAMMFLVSGSRPHHYGLSWARWPANLALGLAVFLVAWPVIMGAHALAVVVFPPPLDPYSALGKLDLPAWEWLLFGFQMTVAAPVIEEIVFRGILQGWLRRATMTGHLALPFAMVYFAAWGFVEYDKDTDQYLYHFGPVVFATVLAIGYGCWLYLLTRHFNLGEAEIQRWRPLPSEPSLVEGDQGGEARRQRRERDEERLQVWADANATLAIFGTAMVFAVSHSSNWPAPLALFPMGLALSWLSRRTQSLVGPITFHALFNLTSFIALYGMTTQR